MLGIKANLKNFQCLNLKIINAKFCSFQNSKGFCTNEKTENQQDLREKLIKMSLINVNKYGWTENSIKIAANELGYSHNLSALLKDGPIDLIYYTMDNWNEKLRKDLDSIKTESHLSLEEKLKKALKLRLSYEIPHVATWPAAIKQGMSFGKIPTTLEKLI
jgi:rpsU-divergently transcribed protein